MKKNIVLLFFIMVCLIAVVGACEKTSIEKITGDTSGTCDTVNMKYSENVVPILTANCYRCHGSGSNTGSGGIVLEGYENLLPYIINQKFYGNITHAPGYIPMPFDGGKLSDCDLSKIKAWLDLGAPNN